MMTIYKICLLWLMLFSVQLGIAQDQGNFSGDIEFVTKFFIADEEIGAANTPQYDNQLIGTEAWVNLGYSLKGFDVGLRFDIYNNSNLQNPNGSFNGTGIGRWFIHKKVDRLDITAGFIYDQIGSGIIYRAYEQRPLFIDNALVGARLTYDLNDNWTLKGFAGKQKNPLGLNREAQDVPLTHGANVKGFAIDGFIHKEGKKLSLAPGFGIVNRTMQTASIEALQNITALYLGEDKTQVELKYNSYAMSLYNRLTVGSVSWYVEAAYKTDSPIFDPFDEKTDANGVTSPGQFVNHDGTVLYTSLSFAKKGLGVVLEAKRTEHFSFRTDPTLGNTNGLINFLPPMNRENTYRLTSRYAPAVQDFGELALQADVSYSFSKKFSANVNFSNITDLNDELLYREIYTELLLKKARKYRLSGGLQLVEYNQRVFEVKPELTENVKTVTPFLEYLHKINRKKSLRIEASYMHTDDDFGSWAYALVEYGVAPHWVFTVSDMYNIDPKKTDKLHYPSVGVAYSQKSNRFQLSYVKQVEGIVCAGGVCRLEPAFSGFKFSLNSTF